MLVSMNSKRLWDLAKGYAKANNKYILVIDNVKWFTLSDTKKATVKTYYDGAGTGSIPQDEVGEIFNANANRVEALKSLILEKYPHRAIKNRLL